MSKVTVNIGDEVVFKDRWGYVHEGTLKSFEREGSKVTGAHIDAGDDGLYLIQWSKVALKGTALANEWQATYEHLPYGTVVLVDGLPAGKRYGGLGNGDYAVVLADKGERVNVAKLGGTGRDEYGRFGHRYLTVVKDFELEVAS